MVLRPICLAYRQSFILAKPNSLLRVLIPVLDRPNPVYDDQDQVLCARKIFVPNMRSSLPLSQTRNNNCPQLEDP